MSFSRYWRDRISESFSNAYRWAQLVGFIILLIVAFLVWRWPLFPYDKLVVWVTAGCFFLYLLKEICFVSPYRHAKKLQSELDSRNNVVSKRREEQSKRVVEKAFELLKRPESGLQPFQALYAAGAANLETNDQVVWVANKLSEHHEHPLQWMQPYVLEAEWLQFLEWGKHHPDFKLDTDDYLRVVAAWAVKHNTGHRSLYGQKSCAACRQIGTAMKLLSTYRHYLPSGRFSYGSLIFGKFFDFLFR